jgi:anoctamin-10
MTNTETAIDEFRALCTDIADAGMQTEVRAGYDQSLLVFARVPKDLLGSTVYKSRFVPP